MATVYVIQDNKYVAFAVDAEESIHAYNHEGELDDVVSRGYFFASDLDFYEINGVEADHFLKERGW